MNAYELFSYNVKYYREQIHASQEDLAWSTHLSTSFISKVERGVSFPNFKSIVKIADALEIPTFALFVTAEEYQAMEESRVQFNTEKMGV